MNIDIKKTFSIPNEFDFFFEDQDIMFKFLTGGKYSGKNYNASIKVMTKWLSNPYRNIIVLSFDKKKNEQSTINDFKFVLEGIRAATGNDRWDFDDVNKNNYLKYGNYPDLRIVFKPTGQTMFFRATDQDNLSGFKLGSIKEFIDTIWIDEIISANLSKVIDEDKMETIDDILRLINSLFRWNKIMEDVVKPEVIFTNNLWNELHFIPKLIDEHVPFNEEKMEKYGWDEHIDKEAHNGLGAYYVRSNYKTAANIKALPKQKIQEIESYEPEQYLTALGKTMRLKGTILSESMDKVDRDFEINDKLYPIGVGIDHGLITDATTAELLFVDSTPIDSMRFKPNYQKLYFVDEYYWTNKDKGSAFKKTNTKMAYEIIEKIINWREQFRSIRILDKFPVAVDHGAYGFYERLKEVVHEIETNTGKDLSWIQILAPTDKYLKQPWTRNRIEWWKSMLDNNMISISENNPYLYDELLKIRVDKNDKPTNKNDHARNGAEYIMFRIIKHILKNNPALEANMNKNV